MKINFLKQETNCSKRFSGKAQASACGAVVKPTAHKEAKRVTRPMNFFNSLAG